ncbi:MAG: aminodeoxychorismate/anthranilate synthase component II [Bacillota bacterium]|uniref:anthranilate synthase component II n=1 Tax=Desulforudis sp. DRI-14 TaxID=3459793 RepID=UPI0034978D45
MVVIIDNYDSFVYSLYQYFKILGKNVLVVRNDEVAITGLKALPISHLVLSPGPCTPDEAGICIEAVRHFSGRLPVLGVCLGHQAIARAFGGGLARARRPMHGKVTPVYHDGRGIYRDLPNPLIAARYHSLIVPPGGLPGELTVTAVDAGGEVMGLRHVEFTVEGVQFHPESILTPQGLALLANFAAIKGGCWCRPRS